MANPRAGDGPSRRASLPRFLFDRRITVAGMRTSTCCARSAPCCCNAAMAGVISLERPASVRSASFALDQIFVKTQPQHASFVLAQPGQQLLEIDGQLNLGVPRVVSPAELRIGPRRRHAPADAANRRKRVTVARASGTRSVEKRHNARPAPRRWACARARPSDPARHGPHAPTAPAARAAHGPTTRSAKVTLELTKDRGKQTTRTRRRGWGQTDRAP